MRYGEPVINFHLVDDGQIELVEDDGLRDVGRELGMPLQDRHRAGAPAFVGGRKLGRAAERKGRDDIDGKRGGVVVIDHDGDIGFRVRHPFLRFLKSREHPLPIGFFGFAEIERRADRRHVRGAYTCDDPCHGSLPLCCGFCFL